MFSYQVFLEESDRLTAMDNRQVICLGVYSQADELTISHKLLQATADSSFSFIKPKINSLKKAARSPYNIHCTPYTI